MLDYERKGYSQYGAQMGRNATDPDGRLKFDTTAKLSLRKVPLNSGGYDPGGAYWGAGEPLWYAADGEGRFMYLRAPDRAKAKAQFPNAKFYR